MSISLSHYAFLPSTTSLCTTSYRHKTLEIKHPRFSLCFYPQLLPLRHWASPIIHCNTNCWFYDIHRNHCRSFLTPSAAYVDAANEENEKRTATPTQNVNLEDQYSFKNLLKLYRDAILHLNQKTISEVESEITIIETKNIELLHKVEALSAETTSGKENYIRLQADFENARKRLEKSRFRVRSDAKREVIESLLPMVDGFEKAKQQLKPETEKEKKINASYQGIYKQFVEIMKSLDVALVPTVGMVFDPAVHEAIGREESAEYREGTVIQELRRGFVLGDRLLRPAKVKVSAGPGIKRSVAGADAGEQPATAT